MSRIAQAWSKGSSRCRGSAAVLDIGCGTGTFALMLAQRGLTVIGLDPAKASLDVARGRPGSESVRWVQAEAPARR